MQYQSLSCFFCFDSQSPILQDTHLDCSQHQVNLVKADLPLSTNDSITTQCLHSLCPRNPPTRRRLLLRGLGSLPRPDFTVFFRRCGSLSQNSSASGGQQGRYVCTSGSLPAPSSLHPWPQLSTPLTPRRQKPHVRCRTDHLQGCCLHLERHPRPGHRPQGKKESKPAASTEGNPDSHGVVLHGGSYSSGPCTSESITSSQGY